MNMKEFVFFRDYQKDIALLIMRICFGLAFALHGYGKVFGGRMDGFANGVAEMGFPLPALFAWAAALSELAGGILLALGLFTRPAALFAFSTMAVAFFIRHGQDPFKVKELAFCYMVFSIAIFASGAGRLSIDSTIRTLRKAAE